ncbi:MAG TPA: SDR family oxidoreductase [Ktedonobacterales bacterium]|jgi:dTDP-4-dehydrorhamnose reductase
MTTLWITGAGGVVGGKLVEQAAASGRYARIRALSHAPVPDLAARYPTVEWAALDLGDRDAVLEQAQVAPPDVVINPAAMTNVDACESRRDEARRANVDGPRWLAEVCRDHNARLLHVSTDYIFPGDDAQPGPYAEDATPRAISYYGQSKLDGERAIATVCGSDTPYAIVRTALVYGLGRRANFVTWLAGELRAGRRVRIVRDQFNTPTIADDLAAVLLWLAEQERTGIYHAAGPDLVGRHEWALAIANHFDLDTSLIDWVSSAELAQPAPRPLRSGLTCARLLAEPDAPRLRGIASGLSEIDWLAS